MQEPPQPPPGDPTVPSEPSGGSSSEAVRAVLGARPDPTPRYVVGETLGRGGVGEVYAAWDPRLRRTIALKSLRRADPGEVAVARFLREAQVTGQLEHPNVVPVYDIGLDPGGTVFYTMKKVQGRSLHQAVRAGALGREARLRIFLQVCEAVAYAHHRGVVHRDLKPANVMLGEFGEVLVLDWGLAKRVGEVAEGPAPSEVPATDDPQLTLADVVMGTPSWMSPEQARGAPAAPAMDQYALGAILYVLVSGKQPFTAGPGVLHDVRAGRFPPPRKVAPDVPKELEAIVLRAMALRPDGRYASVVALKDDVTAFLEGRPVAAMRYTTRDRLGRWAGRNGRAILVASGVASGFALVLVLAVALAGAVWSWGVTNARDVAVAAERSATRQVAETEVALALVDLEAGRPESATSKLAQARAAWAGLGEEDPPLLAIARSYVGWREDPAPIAWTGSHLTGDVAPGGAHVVATNDHGDVWWLDGVTGEPVVRGHADGVQRVLGASAGSGRPLVGWILGREDARDAVYAELLPDGSLERRLTVPLPPTRTEGEGAGISLDGSRAIVAADRVQLYSLADGAPVGPGIDGIWMTGASADLRRILGRPRSSGAFLRAAVDLGVWDAESGERIWYAQQDVEGALSQDGALLAYLDGDPQLLTLVDLGTGATRWTAPAAGAQNLAFLPDGTEIAAIGADGARAFSVRDGQPRGDLPLRDGVRWAFSSGGDAVVVSRPNRLEVRPWVPGRPDRALSVLPGAFSVRAVAFSRDGRLAALASGDGHVRVVDADGGTVLRDITSNPSPIGSAAPGSRDVAFDDAGGRVAVADRDGFVRVWDLASGKLAWKADAGLGIVGSVDWLGDRLVSSHEDGTLVRWDPSTGVERQRWHGGLTSGWSVHLHPDGRRAIVTGRGSADPQLELWDLAAGTRLAVADRTGPAYRGAISPDGRWFAVGTAAEGVWLWDLDATPLTGRRLVETERSVLAVAWTPDGGTLLVGAFDGRITAVDVSRGTELVSLPLHRDGRPVQDIAVRRDGRMLTGGDDSRIVAFDLHPSAGDPWEIPIGAPTSAADRLRGARQAAAWYDWERALALYDAAAAGGAEVPAIERGRVLRELGRSAEIPREAVLAAGMSPAVYPVWAGE